MTDRSYFQQVGLQMVGFKEFINDGVRVPSSTLLLYHLQYIREQTFTKSMILRNPVIELREIPMMDRTVRKDQIHTRGRNRIGLSLCGFLSHGFQQKLCLLLSLNRSFVLSSYSTGGSVIPSGSKITQRSPSSIWPRSRSSYPAFLPVSIVRSTSASGTKM